MGENGSELAGNGVTRVTVERHGEKWLADRMGKVKCPECESADVLLREACPLKANDRETVAIFTCIACRCGFTVQHRA